MLYKSQIITISDSKMGKTFIEEILLFDDRLEEQESTRSLCSKTNQNREKEIKIHQRCNKKVEGFQEMLPTEYMLRIFQIYNIYTSQSIKSMWGNQNGMTPSNGNYGIGNPGMMNPGMMNPGMMNPGMMNPGMMNPGMMMGGTGVVVGSYQLQGIRKACKLCGGNGRYYNNPCQGCLACGMVFVGDPPQECSKCNGKGYRHHGLTLCRGCGGCGYSNRA